MLKLLRLGSPYSLILQPPSGGCVLKHAVYSFLRGLIIAATFGWLCVETPKRDGTIAYVNAATFGWLCVETTCSFSSPAACVAATFGWLCVETCPHNLILIRDSTQPPSGGCVLKRPSYLFDKPPHIAATFGWLCVETTTLNRVCSILRRQPPSGGCVLKSA